MLVLFLLLFVIGVPLLMLYCMPLGQMIGCSGWRGYIH